MTSKGTPASIAAPSGYEALLAIDPSVLEAIPAAVYICAADGVIVRFNRRAEELWGRAPQIWRDRRAILRFFPVAGFEGQTPATSPHADGDRAAHRRTATRQGSGDRTARRLAHRRVRPSRHLERPLRPGSGRHGLLPGHHRTEAHGSGLGEAHGGAGRAVSDHGQLTPCPIARPTSTIWLWTQSFARCRASGLRSCCSMRRA